MTMETEDRLTDLETRIAKIEQAAKSSIGDVNDMVARIRQFMDTFAPGLAPMLASPHAKPQTISQAATDPLCLHEGDGNAGGWPAPTEGGRGNPIPADYPEPFRPPTFDVLTPTIPTVQSDR